MASGRTLQLLGVSAYFSALQKIFDLEAKILSASIPHWAERGRNDEERFRKFLGRVLPTRYTVGSGFIISSEQDVEPSKQNDIVIFDAINNTPIYRELTAFVYPIEIVYATIEVKGCLRRNDISKTLDNLAKIRELSRYKYYIQYTLPPIQGDQSGDFISSSSEIKVDFCPRAFLFAYDADGWKKRETFEEAWRRELKQFPQVKMHGVVVLKKDWFLITNAQSSGSVDVKTFSDDALLRFATTLLDSIGRMQILQMSHARYFHTRDEEN